MGWVGVSKRWGGMVGIRGEGKMCGVASGGATS